MRPLHAAPAGGALAAAAVVGLLLAGAAPAAAQEHPGKETYDRWCAGCHGVEGRGDGPGAAFMLPPPRDFTTGLYQIRTTPSGALPTDADILRIIDDGMPGTAMPGWRERLTRTQREALVDYLKSFSRFFETEPTPEPIDVGRAPRASDERLAEGREMFELAECWRCHGQAGRGDGQSAPTQEDDDGFPIRPADLTKNWRFTGGGAVEDIYKRFLTGMDGTPMPSNMDLIEGGIATEEQLWSLALYVRSLSPERAPGLTEVIRGELREDGLPATPDDPEWEDVRAHYIPLVGQVIVRPRWFAPSVSGVWVQAVHDGTDLVLRLTWNDPSRSPDPAWEEWRERVAAVMEPKEGEPAGAGLPDALTVQFPTVMPEGRDLPYFLMGDARGPVYQWRWSSDGGVAEVLRRGSDRPAEPLAAEAALLSGEAVFHQGQWRLVLRRPLASVDPGRQIGFETGQPIPIAFFAWDGSNGESETRGSISSWYYLHLPEPTPASVYAFPIGATLLTALLGVMLVARAQQRERRRAPGERPEEEGGPPQDAVPAG